MPGIETAQRKASLEFIENGRKFLQVPIVVQLAAPLDRGDVVFLVLRDGPFQHVLECHRRDGFKKLMKASYLVR
ncbi:hypothetical protein J4729_17015 [Leisingera sp. HS039]|nr:hypothetical protein [Leisingera sp. HS039]MBQ4826240.1 hypothetical protein [Leisingera sp. HS039]